VRFLALGDSYTIGEGVADEDRWPNQLTRALRARGFELDDPQLVARTAWTTDELFDAIAEADPRGPYDLVTLMVGVNDQYRSRPVDSFTKEYVTLVRRAIAFAARSPMRVLAISIPDWGATPFAASRDRAMISGEIAAYNDAGLKLATSLGVRWIDLTEMTREMQSNPALVESDGLHPSGEMYRRWSEYLLAPAAEILGFGDVSA